MNIYFIGMCIAMLCYLVIGFIISSKIKDANDFYVAGRRAPVVLIAGSMIASYTSTGMFMGDAAQCYEGVFTSILIFAGMQSAGYIIGAVFFGRYLRRSNVLTIPEFFGKRFRSEKVRALAALTAIIMMTVYLLSVIQGIGTLMNVVTGVNYNVCIALALIVFTVMTVSSGSTGVLITDTIMAGIFTAAMVIATLVISKNVGGWFNAIHALGQNAYTADMLSWSGKLGPLYNSGIENVAWGLIYGIVWMSVCMVGPWQSSRYLMAKDEHTVIRSAPVSALGVFLMEFLVGMVAVMVNLANAELPSSHVMIWAAMNLLPKFLGVVLLTGVLSAGISSATTFLSLIGASLTKDILKTDDTQSIRIGRIVMVVVSIVVFIFAVMNLSSVFWIMFLGGAIASSSWMPVAVASIFSKRVTKAGAFAGMLSGFLGCFLLRLGAGIAGITLPVYLDPSLVGIICNILAMVIVSAMTQVTEEEKQARAELFIMPESEKDPAEIRKTMASAKLSAGVGVIVAAALLIFWVIPYLNI